MSKPTSDVELASKCITHEWMRHLGYEQEVIDGAERLLTEGAAIDVEDEDIVSDLADASEIVTFAAERIYARLRAALGEKEET